MEKTLFEERVSYFIQQRQNRKDTINAMLQMQLVSINSEEKKGRNQIYSFYMGIKSISNTSWRNYKCYGRCCDGMCLLCIQ